MRKNLQQSESGSVFVCETLVWVSLELRGVSLLFSSRSSLFSL
jgi:hypothetical protein